MKTFLKNLADFAVRMTVGLTAGTVVGMAVVGFLHYGLGLDVTLSNAVASLVSIIVTGSVANS
jgi:putative flippase GtrA